MHVLAAGGLHRAMTHYARSLMLAAVIGAFRFRSITIAVTGEIDTHHLRRC